MCIRKYFFQEKLVEPYSTNSKSPSAHLVHLTSVLRDTQPSYCPVISLNPYGYPERYSTELHLLSGPRGTLPSSLLFSCPRGTPPSLFISLPERYSTEPFYILCPKDTQSSPKHMCFHDHTSAHVVLVKPTRQHVLPSFPNSFPQYILINKS